MRPLPAHFTGPDLEPMTAEQAKATREALGLSAAQLAAVFKHKDGEGVDANGRKWSQMGRTVRRWEKDGPTPAVSLALRYLLALHEAEKRPDQ